MIVALTIVVLTGVAWLAFGAVRCSLDAALSDEDARALLDRMHRAAAA